jgi:hypothetical protein
MKIFLREPYYLQIFQEEPSKIILNWNSLLEERAPIRNTCEKIGVQGSLGKNC